MASIFRLASIFRYMHVVSEPAEECRRIRRRRELIVGYQLSLGAPLWTVQF